MKIIHRYVIREFLESFIFGLIVFSSILLLDQIFQLVNLLLSKGIGILAVGKLFLLIIPNILSLTVPMSVLFGILLSFGRLSEDNEITALRSTGADYAAFTRPVLWLVMGFSLFLLVFNHDLSPRTHREFRNMYQKVLTSAPLVKFEEKTITNLGDYSLYAQRVDRKTNVLRGVNIYKFPSAEFGSPWRISAASATVSVINGTVVFTLHNGFWQKPNPAHKNTLVYLQFKTYRFTIPVASDTMPQSQSLREMTTAQLRREISQYRIKKMPTQFLENEFWLRSILALAPVCFAVCGIPLGVVTQRGGKSIGFGISLLVIFGYYVLLISALNLSEKGYVRPALIMWLPDVVMLGCGFYLWKRMRAR